MMAERHRLRDLKMREARHDAAGMFVGARQQSGLNRPQPRVDARARGAHPQAEVGRDLVVARTRGVEAAGGFADQLLEPCLDGHVDVFERQIRSEEHTSELQSLMRISYAVFCLKKKIKHNIKRNEQN